MRKIFVILMIILLSSLVSADLATDTKPYFSFDVADVSGTTLIDSANIMNGTCVNMAGCNTVIGLLLNASEFDGTNEEITTSATISGVQTISMWVNSDIEITSSTNNGALFGRDASQYFLYFGGNLASTISNEVLTFQTTSNKYMYWNSGQISSISANTWHHLVFVFPTTTTAYLYVDNVSIGQANYYSSPVVPSFVSPAVGSRSGSVYFDGDIDEFGIWTRELNTTEISELYNSGAGYNPFAVVPGTNTLNISSPNPINDSQYDKYDINFNATVNSTYDFNCSLYLNNTLNQTKNYLLGNDVAIDFDVTFNVSDWYNYKINCYNNETNENTTTNYFLLDTIAPTLTTDFLNNSVWYNQNISGQFNFSDNLLLHTVNLSIDSSEIIFNESHIHNKTYNYNMNHNISHLSIGAHILNVYFSDGHTAEKLKNEKAYNPSNGLFNNYMKYNFKAPYKKTYIEIQGLDESLFDTFTTEYNGMDRYKIKYKPKDKKSEYKFKVESDDIIYIVSGQNNEYGGQWIIVDEHWLDFYVPDQPNLNVAIRQINDKKVEVTVSGLDNSLDEIEFHSVGDLNIVEQNFTFYQTNATETYSNPIVNEFSTSLNLKLFVPSQILTTPILNWDGTNYSSSATTSNSTEQNFVATIFVNETINNYENKSHFWYFNLTNVYSQTASVNQKVYDIEVGICEDNKTNAIINFSYHDEISDDLINSILIYNFDVSDGTYEYDQTGTFTNENTSALCTNVQDDLSYNWNLWGDITSLSSTGYIPRSYTYQETSPLLLNNINPYNLSLYLITINESTTMTYTWITTNFQNVDGTMRIYKCENDGSKTLIVSSPIISGQAVANIQLLVQQYSYDVIIDGVVYSEPTSYGVCHVETSNTRTYYVDVTPTTIDEDLGLQLVDCTITKTGIDTVNMSWGSNGYSSEAIEGCILAFRSTIQGNVEVYENCTSSSNSIARTIPITGYSYTIKGTLTQGDNIVMCGDIVVFYETNEVASSFGLSGILGIIILIMSLTLFFAGENTATMVGASFGILLSWFLGIMNLEPIQVTGLILFGIILALIGRRRRL